MIAVRRSPQRVHVSFRASVFALHTLPRAPTRLRARFRAENYQKSHQDYGFCRGGCQIERERALPIRTECSQGARALLARMTRYNARRGF